MEINLTRTTPINLTKSNFVFVDVIRKRCENHENVLSYLFHFHITRIKIGLQ